jgi:hypothetical protein
MIAVGIFWQYYNILVGQEKTGAAPLMPILLRQSSLMTEQAIILCYFVMVRF